MLMIFLREPNSRRQQQQQSRSIQEESKSVKIVESIGKILIEKILILRYQLFLINSEQSFSLMMTRQMAMLCITFWYTGIELSFFSGVYTTALGRTSQLDHTDGNAKKYVGLAGMLIGVGEIVGGLIFGILGSRTVRIKSRDPIVITGYFVHMVAFFLIFLNFPPDSTINSKPSEATYIEPSLTIALLCSFLLGFADSCYNTQIYSILGSLYADDSAPAFALFKFWQSMACACAFFYAPISNLYVQLLILVIFASLGSISFVMVEWRLRRDASMIESDHQN